MSEVKVPPARALAKTYVALQRLRQSVESRLRAGAVEDAWIRGLLGDLARVLREEERGILEEVRKRYCGTPLFRWCERVRGMGEGAALFFLGFVNPYVSSAGKVKSYLGFVPGKRRKRGEVGGYSPVAKSKLWLVARNVVMRRDEYYFPLFSAKKQYYLERGCCSQHEPGRPGYRAHAHAMAMRFLAGMLASHAWELYRESLGLDARAAKEHRPYVPPKPEGFDPSDPPEWYRAALEMIRRGERGFVPSPGAA